MTADYFLIKEMFLGNRFDSGEPATFYQDLTLVWDSDILKQQNLCSHGVRI